MSLCGRHFSRNRPSSGIFVVVQRRSSAQAPRHRILPAVVGFRCRQPAGGGQRTGLSIDRRRDAGDGGFVTARCTVVEEAARCLSDSNRAAGADDVGPDFSPYDTKRILTYQKVDGTSKRRCWQRDADFWQTSLHTSVTKEDTCHATLITTSDVTVTSHSDVSCRWRLRIVIFQWLCAS